MRFQNDTPKAPRWISTEAGLWAWAQHGGWRTIAANAMLVEERQQLLHQAEQLRAAHKIAETAV
ncbi:MAG: hypothetical protein JST60_23100 [Chloroflexi bacterium SZAS-1]|jgi:hypothetical protein|nr:hypothetical protein [Chloroflexi bacterium SZAS-1]HNP86142.1 hypothetical protein [Kouleothrix sp.]